MRAREHQYSDELRPAHGCWCLSVVALAVLTLLCAGVAARMPAALAGGARVWYQAAELQRRTTITSAEQKFQDEKRHIEEKALAKRKSNQKEWFDGIKSLMEGDFKAFTDMLSNKLLGEEKQLSARQKANIDTIDKVGEYTVMAVQAISKLNQMALEKQLATSTKKRIRSSMPGKKSTIRG